MFNSQQAKGFSALALLIGLSLAFLFTTNTVEAASSNKLSAPERELLAILRDTDPQFKDSGRVTGERLKPIATKKARSRVPATKQKSFSLAYKRAWMKKHWSPQKIRAWEQRRAKRLSR